MTEGPVDPTLSSAGVGSPSDADPSGATSATDELTGSSHPGVDPVAGPPADARENPATDGAGDFAADPLGAPLPGTGGDHAVESAPSESSASESAPTAVEPSGEGALASGASALGAAPVPAESDPLTAEAAALAGAAASGAAPATLAAHQGMNAPTAYSEYPVAPPPAGLDGDGAWGQRTPADPIQRRLEALRAFVPAARGRVPVDDLSEAARLLERASQRAQLSQRHTVAALVGGTGGGKSALFNALVGLPLSRVGHERPTTPMIVSCTWGPDPADDLLEWFGVHPRHRFTRGSVLDPNVDADLAGLVLLDMPDHDSLTTAHRAQVDVVVHRADLLLWVVDPQKYADSLLHKEYLARMLGRESSMIVVVNQSDRLNSQQLAQVKADVARLVREDGLEPIPVLTTSARFGDGVPALRQLLNARAHTRTAAHDRVLADLTALSQRLVRNVGQPSTRAERNKAYEGFVSEISTAVDLPAAARRGAAGEALAVTLVPTVATEAAIRYADASAGTLAKPIHDRVVAAAVRSAVELPARVTSSVAAVNVAALRRVRTLFRGRGVVGAEREERCLEALSGAVRQSLTSVMVAVDTQLAPYDELSRLVDEIGH